MAAARKSWASRLTRLQEQQARLRKDLRNNQGGVAEMGETLGALQRKFQQTIGKIEELQHQLGQMLQKHPELRKMYTELHARYEALLRDQKALADQVVPARLYGAARKLAQEKKWKGARKRFVSFVRRFPAHPLVDNAYMAIGECWEREGNIAAAVLAYGQVARKHSTGRQAPKALFRLGLLHYKLGSCVVGRNYLRRLYRRYRRREPKLARQARKLARRRRSLCRSSRRSGKRRKGRRKGKRLR